MTPSYLNAVLWCAATSALLPLAVVASGPGADALRGALLLALIGTLARIAAARP